MACTDMELYKQIFENIPEGVAVCDAGLKVIEVNKAFELLTGCDKSELIGKSCLDIIKPDNNNCSICSNGKTSSFAAENYIHTASLKARDGKTIPVRVNHSRMDNSYILVVSVLSNVACLDQAHIDFVSTVSHELRTPLTSIKGFADTLLTAEDRLDAESRRRFITIIKSQIDRLTRLVENLLTVSRLESKNSKAIYKAINFKDFLPIVLQTISMKAKEHNIKVEIMPNLPPVWADSDKLEQIMTNLIDNAIKYSNPSTTVVIKAGFAPNNPDFIEIKVADQGVGIPKEFLPKIFTKFSRIDNPLTRQVQGTGLGLYITKSLVEGMGSKISVSSDEKGTEFSVMLLTATPEKHVAQKFMEKE